MPDPQPIAPPIPLLYHLQDFAFGLFWVALTVVFTLGVAYALTYYGYRRERAEYRPTWPPVTWNAFAVPLFWGAVCVAAFAGIFAMILPDGSPS